MSNVVSAGGTTPQIVSIRYQVAADASPGLLPRLLQPFAKRDIVPDRLWSRRDADTLHVEFDVHELPAEYAHLIEANLRQVVGVQTITPTLAQRTI